MPLVFQVNFKPSLFFYLFKNKYVQVKIDNMISVCYMYVFVLLLMINFIITSSVVPQ